MSANERGFTIVEVLVAVMVLSIGIMALAGSSALVTRMVGRGKTSTLAAQVAARRLEDLRRIAASTATPCTSVNFISGSLSTPDHGITESWVVENGTAVRQVIVFVTYKTAGSATKTDTVSTLIPCVS